jgi:hypothetical protein
MTAGPRDRAAGTADAVASGVAAADAADPC